MLTSVGEIASDLIVIGVLWYLIALYSSQVSATERIGEELTSIRKILEKHFE